MPASKPLRDYYQILGVEKSASQEAIRAAYRRLAWKFHPDLNKSEDSLFWMQLINEAYEVLGDRGKKALYDYIFFAHSHYSLQVNAEGTVPASRLSPQPTGFRNSFSRFIVTVIDLEEVLNVSLLGLVIVAVSFYMVFGMGELAAGMLIALFVLACMVLMVRIVAEIFGRAGIRCEEEWFPEAFAAAGYLDSHGTKTR